MANGVLIFKIVGNTRPEIIAKYNDDGFDSNLARKIANKHTIYGEEAHPKDMLSYRTDESKYYSIYITQNEKNENVFLVFILDSNESIAPFSIMLSELREFIILSLNKSESVLKDAIKHILEERNDLIQDVRDVKRLQERIVTKANELLDEKNFEKTQEMIKRANEIPPKIANLCKKADQAFHDQKNYRQAQRYYKEASNLAKKIKQKSISKLLEQKAKRAEEIPQFAKNWAITYDQIVKPLRKIEKRDHDYYLKPIKLINRAIEISDFLEEDKTIEDLQKLADYLERANDLMEEVDAIDEKIKEVLIKIKR
ncbi:MAG: hypothetical protein JW776_10235 [Candidatus Lokiarchaeota archaeon]|nr:hypothetical protein [Candidatus Lokiarchaeota archaeon]